MFTCDASQAPIFRLVFTGEFSAADERAYLTTLDHLLNGSTPYALIMVADGKHLMSHASRREHAIWFKRNKHRLAVQCLGIVRIRPDWHPDTIDWGHFRRYQRAMPYPVEIARNLEEGYAIAQRWVSDQVAEASLTRVACDPTLVARGVASVGNPDAQLPLPRSPS